MSTHLSHVRVKVRMLASFLLVQLAFLIATAAAQAAGGGGTEPAPSAVNAMPEPTSVLVFATGLLLVRYGIKRMK